MVTPEIPAWCGEVYANLRQAGVELVCSVPAAVARTRRTDRRFLACVKIRAGRSPRMSASVRRTT